MYRRHTLRILPFFSVCLDAWKVFSFTAFDNICNTPSQFSSSTVPYALYCTEEFTGFFFVYISVSIPIQSTSTSTRSTKTAWDSRWSTPKAWRCSPTPRVLLRLSLGWVKCYTEYCCLWSEMTSSHLHSFFSFLYPNAPTLFHNLPPQTVQTKPFDIPNRKTASPISLDTTSRTSNKGAPARSPRTTFSSRVG